MAVNSVSLVESLRPWKNMGLHCLLFSSAEEAQTLAFAGSGQPRRGAPGRPLSGAYAPGSPQISNQALQSCSSYPEEQSAQRGQSVPGEGPGKPERPAAHRAAQAMPGRQSAARSGAPSSPPAPSDAPFAPYAASGPTGLTGGPVAPPAPAAASSAAAASDARRKMAVPLRPDHDKSAAWPESWASLWRRTRPAPVLWTYPELGQDLLGQGSAERSKLLKRLVSDLAFPKGSSVFWPCRLPGDPVAPAGRKADASPFLQGLELLQPKVIILAGLETLTEIELAPASSLPFTQTLYAGKLTLLLPDLDAMAREENNFARCVAFLRTALAGLPFLQSR